MKPFIMTFVVLCLTASSYAGLGETPEQLAKRFKGPPHGQVPHQIVEQGRAITIGETLYFRDGKISVSAFMIEGRCAKAHYSKTGAWTDDQIAQILSANSQGGQWEMTSHPSIEKARREWKRDDNSTAKWNWERGFTAENPAYERAVAKARAQAVAEASKAPKTTKGDPRAKP
jgi:hypothetical protein